QQCGLSVKVEVARRSSPVAFITGVKEKIDPLSLSIRWGCRENSWRANDSAKNKARLLAPTDVRRARSNWPKGEQSFSMRSAMFPRNCKPSSCGFFRNANSNEWEESHRFLLM